MRQKIWATFFTAAIFLLLGQAAWAHNSIVTTYPVKGVETDRSGSDVSIIFNAKIEKIRSFVVQNKSGEDIKHTKRIVDGNAMTLYYKKPLKPGTYRVLYDIVSADGHSVHGAYSFTVLDPSKTEKNNEQQEAQDPNKENKTEPGTESQASSEKNEITKAEKTEQDFERNMPIFIVLLIGLGAVAGLGLFLALRKNKA